MLSVVKREGEGKRDPDGQEVRGEGRKGSRWTGSKR